MINWLYQLYKICFNKIYKTLIIVKIKNMKGTNYTLKLDKTKIEEIKDIKGFKTTTRAIYYAVNNIAKYRDENIKLKRLLSLK